MMIDKQDIINIYIDLFTRGEMIKGEKFINECVPLELQDDKDIIMMKNECNTLMSNIRECAKVGRKYPGTHSSPPFETFPKFVLAREKILGIECKRLLDVGCYSGVFIEHMSQHGIKCFGIDIHKELMKKLNKCSDCTTTYKFASVESIPFKDNYFNVVTAFDTLEHVLDLDKSISEMERVCKEGGMIMINLPRMEPDYKDDAFEHLRMFSDRDIYRIWGKKKEYKFELCLDELYRDTSFITYIK